MNTITIYANYGVLAAEKRRVYSERPISQIHDKITVKIPKEFTLYETVMGSLALESSWGTCYTINELLSGDEDPIFEFIDQNGKLRKIKLERI